MFFFAKVSFGEVWGLRFSFIWFEVHLFRVCRFDVDGFSFPWFGVRRVEIMRLGLFLFFWGGGAVPGFFYLVCSIFFSESHYIMN